MTTERIPIVDRASWLEMRKQDVTASDIAAIAGLSPYKTALQVWAEKTGRSEGPQENEAMRRGRWLENAVIIALQETKPRWQIWRPNVYLRDKALRLGATPDAVAETSEGEIIIQCKVVARPVFDAWDGPPIAYQLQTLTEAMLWGAKFACIAALVVDTFTAELVIFQVERHPAAEEKIRKAVAQFWADIADGKQPYADYGRDGELLLKLYKPKEGIEPLDLSADNLLPEILEERRGLMDTVKRCEERLAAIKAEVIHKLNGATIAVLPGWSISHKIQHRKEVIIPAKSFPVLRITKRETA